MSHNNKNTLTTTTIAKEDFTPASQSGYSVYISHKTFDEFTALYDWRAKAYRVAELLALPIRMRVQAACTIEVSLLEETGMTKLEHAIDIKLYEQPFSTKSATNPNQHEPEGFDYAEVRVAINRIVHQMDY